MSGCGLQPLQTPHAIEKLNIDWKQFRETELSGFLLRLDHLKDTLPSESADLGEHALSECQAMFEFLRQVGAIAPDEASPFKDMERVLTCLEKPWVIDSADMNTVVAALTFVYVSAQRGDFTVLAEALSGWQKRTQVRVGSALAALLNRLDALSKHQPYLESLGNLACPVCGATVSTNRVDPDTRRVLCVRCGTVAPVESAAKTALMGLTAPDNPYESFHSRWHLLRNSFYQYHVFVSYRNIAADHAVAQEIAQALATLGLRVFFAPRSLWMENLLDAKGTWPTQWVSELKSALLTSVHFVVVLSQDFSTSTHCELELRSIHDICAKNPKRKHRLRLLGISPDELPFEVRHLVVSDDAGRLAREIEEEVRVEDFDLGRTSVEPTTCFSPLPLTTSAWGEGRSFDPDPPFEEFADIVRELLLLALRGLDPSSVPFVFPNRWQSDHIEQARHEVDHLLDSGVMPYPPCIYDELGDRLRARAPKEHLLADKAQMSQTLEGQSAIHYRSYEPEPDSWYVLEDYGGKGYPQDMDCLCKTCGASADVSDFRNPPNQCPNCGARNSPSLA